MKRILVMGLPDTGKTTLSKAIVTALSKDHTVLWLNADAVRAQFNDWDFSTEGRLRQAQRMRDIADEAERLGRTDYVLADFIAPLQQMRDIYDADVTIWVDTLPESKYADTNAIFEPPEKYDYRVGHHDENMWVHLIAYNILNDKPALKMDWPTYSRYLDELKDKCKENT